MAEDQASYWRASASPGGLIGIVILLLMVLAAGTAVLGITGRSLLPLPDVALWIVLGLAVGLGIILGFLVWAYATIGYQLSADELRIRWGLWSDTIRFSEIEQIVPAVELLGSDAGGWRLFWPGYYVGQRSTGAGPVRVVATLPQRRQILIRTVDGRQFAISPERPMLFMEELARYRDSQSSEQFEPAVSEPDPQPEPVQRLVDAGWTQEYSTAHVAYAAEAVDAETPQDEIERPVEEQQRYGSRVYRSRPSSTSPLLRPIILRDMVSLAFIGIGVLTTALMVVFILVQYDDIPRSITLHWNVDGLPGRVGEPREIWILPTIAGLVLLANLGLAWSVALFDRFAARLLLGSTILVHIVTWIALIMVLR